MISLDIQIKLIVFSFIFGFLFSAFLEWFNKIIIECNSFIKITFSFFIVFFSFFIYFVGIQKIVNSIFHIYSIICILLVFFSFDFFFGFIVNNNKK